MTVDVIKKFRGNKNVIRALPSPLIASTRGLILLLYSALNFLCFFSSSSLTTPMLRSLPLQFPRRLFSVSAKMASTTPMEDLMRDKVHPSFVQS